MKKYALLLLLAGAVVIFSLFIGGAFNRHSHSAPPVAVTAELPSITIVIDPGHGGRDPGVVVGDLLEKDLNLELANRVRTLTEKQPGLQAVLTRTSDITVDNLDRLRMAEGVGAALYLSIHINAYDDPRVHGAETWVDSTRPTNDPSWHLAEAVQKALVAATGARDRCVRSQELYLRHTVLPAASVEVGFLTCPEERTKLLDPSYQDKVAQGITKGILDYLNTNETPPQETALQSG